MGVLGMMHRGRHEHPGFVGAAHLEESKCIECGQCAVVCPTGGGWVSGEMV